MPPRLNHAGRYVFQVLRQHWLAALLFAVGIALRAIAMAAYHPALLYVDSLKYLYGAWPGSDPIGYEVPLKAVLLVGDLGLMALLQHLLGLVMAAVLYVLLLRKGVNRWLSALAIAPVLLDAYQLQAEQTIMPDVVFEAMVLIGLAILVWKPAASWLTVAIAGLVLGAAVTVHQAGLILVVPAVAYLLVAGGPLFRRGGWRPAISKSIVICVAFAVPVLGYCSVMYAVHGHFRLSTQGNIVGRAAQSADCATLRIPADVRPICPTPAEQVNSPDWFEHNGASPLLTIDVPRAQRSKLFKILDHAVERQQPLRVVGKILSDSIRLYEVDRVNSPAITPITRWQFQKSYPNYLPEVATQPNGNIIVGVQYRLGKGFHLQLLKPSYGGKAQVDKPLATFLHYYQLDGGYTPGPLLLIFTLLGLAGSIVALFRRKASPGERQVAVCCLLFFVTAAGVLLVSDIYVFSWRYQLQALTTLPPAGVLGATALLQAFRRRSAASTAAAESLAAPAPADATAAGA